MLNRVKHFTKVHSVETDSYTVWVVQILLNCAIMCLCNFHPLCKQRMDLCALECRLTFLSSVEQGIVVCRKTFTSFWITVACVRAITNH